MKWYRKLDAYLLKNHPAIWITKVHLFLPIGIGAFLLCFFGDLLIGWDLKSEIPNGEIFTMLLIIPVILYVVFWFIIQARYSVLKNNGKISWVGEYLSFIISVAILSVATALIMSALVSNDLKITNAISQSEIEKDVAALDLGNSLVNLQGVFEEKGANNYLVGNSYFRGFYNEEDSLVVLSRREVESRIESYIKSYNKYTYKEIKQGASEIIELRLLNKGLDSEGFRDRCGNAVNKKISKIKRLQRTYYDQHKRESEAWFGILAFILIGAMVSWIFKQVNGRVFIITTIAIAVTPILFAIIYGILDVFIPRAASHDEELYFLIIVFLGYAVLLSYTLIFALRRKVSRLGHIITTYFHFWLPFLVYFIFWAMALDNHAIIREKHFGLSMVTIMFLIGYSVIVVSIIVFKPIYSKYRNFPKVK